VLVFSPPQRPWIFAALASLFLLLRTIGEPNGKTDTRFYSNNVNKQELTRTNRIGAFLQNLKHLAFTVFPPLEIQNETVVNSNPARNSHWI